MGAIINAKSGIVPCLAAALLLQGCVHLLPAQRAEMIAGTSRAQRESILQSMWEGRPYVALVTAYGPPRMLMKIPGDRPNELVAVYGIRDDVSGCIDAFTVFLGRARTAVNDDSMVTHYFCR